MNQSCFNQPLFGGAESTKCSSVPGVPPRRSTDLIFIQLPVREIDAPSDVFRFSWQIKYSDKSPTFTTRGSTALPFPLKERTSVIMSQFTLQAIDEPA